MLTTTKEPNKKESNADATIEDICVDHIHSYEHIREKMKEIKEKFNLTDATDWRTVMQEVGKRKRDQNGNPKTFNKGKDHKGNDSKGRNVRGKDGGKGRDNKGRKDFKEKGKQNKTKNEKNDKNGKSIADSTENVSAGAADEVAEERSSGTQAKKNAKNSPINKKRKPESKSENGTPKAKNAKTESKPKSTESDVPAALPKVTAEDSFFITSSGASYQSTAVVDRIQVDGPNDGLARKERRAKQFGRTIPDNNKSNKFNKSGGSAKLNNKNDSMNGDEHPSWAAKKKQKTIPNFQPQSASKSADSNVHPSWAAKQKLKPVITEFKGSKTTFD